MKFMAGKCHTRIAQQSSAHGGGTGIAEADEMLRLAGGAGQNTAQLPRVFLKGLKLLMQIEEPAALRNSRKSCCHRGFQLPAKLPVGVQCFQALFRIASAQVQAVDILRQMHVAKG